MKILVCGASGFIGAALCASLSQAGHQVTKGVRKKIRPSSQDEVEIDYTHNITENIWIERLRGIDVVVNAVGVIIEKKNQRFDEIHCKAPQALFSACVQAGVKRVIQVSALGATTGESHYFRSKRAADEYLMKLPIEWQIVRPSLVYGEEGASAKLFRLIASMPVLVLPAGGGQKLQPVHIQDVVDAIIKLIDPATSAGQCIDLVGLRSVTYREMLLFYRKAMGFSEPYCLSIPGFFISMLTESIGRLPGSLLNRETWQMLQAGNTGNPHAITNLLGHAPLSIENFIIPTRANDLANRALTSWRTPFLQIVLSVIWIHTAIVTVFIFPLQDSLTLLEKIKFTGMPALITLYGLSALDGVIGLTTLLVRRRWFWVLQIILIFCYSVVIAWKLPEFLIHPFGPIIKNMAILAILIILIGDTKK